MAREHLGSGKKQVGMRYVKQDGRKAGPELHAVNGHGNNA